jgi:hypothetical protein
VSATGQRSTRLRPHPDRVQLISGSLDGEELTYQIVWDMIALNVCIYFILMVAVVAESVENLRKIQMRQLPAYLFWRRALSPQFDYCANRRACVPDNRLPTQNLIVACNV